MTDISQYFFSEDWESIFQPMVFLNLSIMKKHMSQCKRCLSGRVICGGNTHRLFIENTGTCKEDIAAYTKAIKHSVPENKMSVISER